MYERCGEAVSVYLLGSHLWPALACHLRTVTVSFIPSNTNVRESWGGLAVMDPWSHGSWTFSMRPSHWRSMARPRWWPVLLAFEGWADEMIEWNWKGYQSKWSEDSETRSYRFGRWLDTRPRFVSVSTSWHWIRAETSSFR